MTSASRGNKFGFLNLTERGLKVEEVNAVDVVHEVLEIAVDSGVAKSVFVGSRTKSFHIFMLWQIRWKGAGCGQSGQQVPLSVTESKAQHLLFCFWSFPGLHARQHQRSVFVLDLPMTNLRRRAPILLIYIDTAIVVPTLVIVPFLSLPTERCPDTNIDRCTVGELQKLHTSVTSLCVAKCPVTVVAWSFGSMRSHCGHA